MQDLVITAVENRFGRINMLSEPIEWLTDNGSCFVARTPHPCSATSAWNLARHRCEAHRSNGMAEAFVKTFKRDYVSVNPTPDAETVMAQTAVLVRALQQSSPAQCFRYQAPREFISSQSQT